MIVWIWVKLILVSCKQGISFAKNIQKKHASTPWINQWIMEGSVAINKVNFRIWMGHWRVYALIWVNEFITEMPFLVTSSCLKFCTIVIVTIKMKWKRIVLIKSYEMVYADFFILHQQKLLWFFLNRSQCHRNKVHRFELIDAWNVFKLKYENYNWPHGFSMQTIIAFVWDLLIFKMINE